MREGVWLASPLFTPPYQPPWNRRGDDRQGALGWPHSTLGSDWFLRLSACLWILWGPSLGTSLGIRRIPNLQLFQRSRSCIRLVTHPSTPCP